MLRISLKCWKFPAIAASPIEAVALLRDGAYTDSDDLTEYMQEAAQRALIKYGAVIRTDTAEGFLRDLEILDDVVIEWDYKPGQ